MKWINNDFWTIPPTIKETPLPISFNIYPRSFQFKSNLHKGYVFFSVASFSPFKPQYPATQLLSWTPHPNDTQPRLQKQLFSSMQSHTGSWGHLARPSKVTSAQTMNVHKTNSISHCLHTQERERVQLSCAGTFCSSGREKKKKKKKRGSLMLEGK